MAAKAKAQNNTPSFFLRPGVDAGTAMAAQFEIEGKKGWLYMSSKKELAFFENTASGKRRAKPTGTGSVEANSSTNENAPHGVGSLKVGKAEHRLALWKHEDHTGAYYVVKLDQLPERAGAFFDL